MWLPLVCLLLLLLAVRPRAARSVHFMWNVCSVYGQCEHFITTFWLPMVVSAMFFGRPLKMEGPHDRPNVLFEVKSTNSFGNVNSQRKVYVVWSEYLQETKFQLAADSLTIVNLPSRVMKLHQQFQTVTIYIYKDVSSYQQSLSIMNNY